jgi:pyridoxal 5'-phosphate synthase pdxT subunit
MIGILGLQGDVEEHERHLHVRCPAVRIVKRPPDLQGIRGLVLPGGESTAISRLIRSSGLESPVLSLIRKGLPVWGTCAGTILLCRGGIWESVDASVERNAYGSQLHSAVKQGRIHGSGRAVPMVFIRAPRIASLSERVNVLAEEGGDVVAARQGNILLTTFHPELSTDPFFLDLFLDMTGARPCF